MAPQAPHTTRTRRLVAGTESPRRLRNVNPRLGTGSILSSAEDGGLTQGHHMGVSKNSGYPKMDGL